MMFLQANGQRKSISRFEVGVLFALSMLLHGALVWRLSRSSVAPPEVPRMSTAGGDNTVMLDLIAPAEQPKPAPAPRPKPVPVPPRPQKPVSRVVHVDENAVRPAPEKKVTEEKTVTPAPVPEPAPVSSAAAEHADASAATTGGHADAAGSGAPGQPIVPAVSGMQSLGNPPPDYPPLALRREQQGTVVLRILVLENGRAGSVTVVRSSHSELLDKAAVDTVSHWHFIPAKRGDVAIKGWAIQSITFKLPA